MEQATQRDITTTVLLQILEDRQHTAAKLLRPEFLASVIRLEQGHYDPDLPEHLISVIRGAESAGNALASMPGAKRLASELS